LLGNLINFQDVKSVLGLIKRSEYLRLFRILSGRRETRVREAWSHLVSKESGMWDIPAIQIRWRQMVTGKDSIDFYEYFFTKYVHRPPRMLSLACGSGETDIRIAKMGKVRRIDGYDISRERIESATAKAKTEGLEDIACFHQADLMEVEFGRGIYDVVLAEGALHHLSPLDTVFDKISLALKRDGFLFINDFVGPTRFQWTDRQMEAANAILRALPLRYRAKRDGKPKPEIFRPSRLSMILGDPSEAVESGNILPEVRKRFEVIEEKGFGGTLLHILLGGIAHTVV
jgi:SAM-dependent methyltransferase